MHVAVVGSDVEVAGEHQLRVRGDFLGQPFFQRGEPVELVGVFFAADLLPVRHVGADDAQITDSRRDQAFLRVGVMRVAANDVGERRAGEQGDAVVGFLPGKSDVVASGLDLGLREVVILELGLLQADHVGLCGRQPVQQLRQANLEGINVPGGEFHGVKVPEGLLP